ncbi:hypothetical protein GCM10023143_08230 [Compostibacter hankyongensis]|uniref:Uncharacterized protein n=2 Tax=Compostibacter hankyongensis TaxID=1007089 RepID=A0ABP8FHU1_9BACT
MATLFCMMSNSLLGQAIQKPGQYKVGRHIISVEESSTYHSLWITEDGNIISDMLKNPRSLIRFEGMKFSGRETINSTFVRVLGISRIKELIYDPKQVDILVILYAVASQGNGKVVGVQFMIPSRQKIRLTSKELVDLTIFMKRHITLSLPPNVTAGSRIAPFSQTVKFSRLLNE